MNIKEKLKRFEKDPELLALGGFFALFMLLVVNKLGVVIGKLMYELMGK